MDNRIFNTAGIQSPMLCNVVVFRRGSPQERLFRLFRYNGTNLHPSGMSCTAIWPSVIGADVPFNLPGTVAGDVTVLHVWI
jgi:hypothetical protein